MTAPSVRAPRRSATSLAPPELWRIAVLGLLVGSAAGQIPVDRTAYAPECGVVLSPSEDALQFRWEASPRQTTTMTLNLAGSGPLVRSIAVGSPDSDPVIVLRDADPTTVVSVAQRDLRKRAGWNIFFDRVQRKPKESGPLTLDPKRVSIRSTGRRCEIDIDGLEGESFSGKLRFTLYAGCELIHVQAVVSTDRDARALLYHAGLTFDPTGKAVTWIGLDDKVHRVDGVARAATPHRVRHRTIAVETKAGALAVFPAPHQYFYPLDQAHNLGFVWSGSGFMKLVPGFGIGIRQDPMGDKRYVPWFNAPPNTEQRLGVFWLPTRERGVKLFDRVKAYTHGDRFPEIPGHKTFTSHYHIEHTTHVLKAPRQDQLSELPPSIRSPQFMDVFKNAGVQIVHLAEFHNRLGRDRRDAAKGFALLKLLHDECERLSDDQLLLLPGEEPNVHLGGHWISFFPRPVMWALSRPEGKPLVEVHPKYGRVYHVGSSEDVLELMKRENGLMWAAHPRIKSSTGYPDRYRDEPFFKSDRYLGGAWKAMPADLSRERLGWRVLDLLDDTANWGARKYIVGEVDIFHVNHTTEFYAHANINYLRLDRVPRFKEGWLSILEALRDGAFFISTGEVLMPSFTVGGKNSGQTLQLDASGKTELVANLSWTFPMAFAEVITGDGQSVQRRRIDMTETGAFGKNTIRVPLNLRGKTWVRFEAWDVAANGVISQPIWVR